MCGITGFLGGDDELPGRDVLARMADTIVHRGPDDAGYWVDAEKRIGLGFRRLAIIDLTSAGSQPMISASGRYVMIFNGEIYNHPELRRTLAVHRGAAAAAGHGATNVDAEGIRWRGHSDSETILAAMEAWGIRGAIERLTGMFAIGVWDREKDELTLVRDRAGEKPLYYGWQGGTFLFGSELKALRAHPAFVNAVSRKSVGLMLRFQCVPAPYSIYAGISKLQPGSMVTVSLRDRLPAPQKYWSVADAVRRGRIDPFVGDEREATNQLEVLLRRVVASQMMSDVPLGAFLSGGVDSSAIVALMQAQSTNPIKTFTIGFHESSFDESRHAFAVAKHLGTDHTNMFVSGEEALNVIPSLPSLYDEPFSDSSQIPTFLVAKLARQTVTVSLSGDGGDEIFAGYNRYGIAARYWNMIRMLPVGIRRVIASKLLQIPEAQWERVIARLVRAFGVSRAVPQLGYKIRKGAGVLTSANVDALYQGLVSHWRNPSTILVDGSDRDEWEAPDLQELPELGPVGRMMALDQLTFLPDDILVKVDRAGMGVSLETRMPLLDRRVVEFAWSLPQRMKLRRGVTKWVLRQVLHRYVPRELIERPKMGFGMPIGIWLRGPLRDWAEDLLSEDRLKREGILQPEPIRRKWHEHLERRENWEYHLWDVLMFQSWLAAQQ